MPSSQRFSETKVRATLDSVLWGDSSYLEVSPDLLEVRAAVVFRPQTLCETGRADQGRGQDPHPSPTLGNRSRQFF